MAKSLRSAEVVIGAGYGDEGKGVLTDALAARHSGRTTVIRFNGGAQAGHTVTLADGRRHIFHHVASGTLAGASTFLSRFFVANPMFLADEIAALERLGAAPRIVVDPAAPVTTPYDMMINQIVEEARGTGRHGSCGLGFGETIERNLRPHLALTAGATGDRDRLRTLLQSIRTEWVPERLRRLSVGPVGPAARADIASDEIVERWLDDMEAFRDSVTIAPIDSLSGPLIFEGAQGLMLDQDAGAFPHVTRSNTGLKNVVALAADLGLEALDVTYATRVYVTRHGAGPLAREIEGPPHPDVVDRTNIPNAWQGSLRFADLDLYVLRTAIETDLRHAQGAAPRITTRLAVTCLDQVGPAVAYFAGGTRREATPEALAALAARTVGAAGLVTGRGPTRADLSEFTDRKQAA